MKEESRVVGKRRGGGTEGYKKYFSRNGRGERKFSLGLFA